MTTSINPDQTSPSGGVMPGGYKTFFMLNSSLNAKMLKNQDFSCFKTQICIYPANKC